MKVMNVPPSMPAGKAQRSPAFWIIGALVAMVCCVGVPIIAAILFPVFSQAREAAKRTESIENIKTLGTAVMIYIADYDDVYPPAERWETLITPILSDPDALVAPQATQPVAYAFNSGLALVEAPSLPNANTTPMIFESNVAGPNAWGSSNSIYVRSRKVILGFADTSARAVDESMVATFTWNPEARRRQ
jgi:hypothetical protein